MRKYIFLIALLLFLNFGFAQTETRNLCNAEEGVWFSSLSKCCGNELSDNFYGAYKWGVNYYCCNGNIRAEIDDFIEEIGTWPVESGAIYSSPAIIDLENDGRKEILIGSTLNRVPVWRYRGKPDLVGTGVTESSVYSSPVSADLDNDGYTELIALAGSKIYVWDHLLNLKQGWPVAVEISTSIPTQMSSPAVADIDNNGDLEIFVGTTGGYIYGFHHDGSAVSGWPFNTGGKAILSSPAISDINNDGNPDIVIGGNTEVYALNKDGSLIFTRDLIGQAITTSSPALADLNNNGYLEIIILSTPYIYTDEVGNVLVSYNQYLNVLNYQGLDFFSPVLIVSNSEVSSSSASSAAVGDINEDGNLEIVFTSDNGKIHVFNKLGQEISGFPASAGSLALSSPALADLDNDGYLDIIFGSFNGNLYAFKKDGSIFAGFPKYIGGQIFSSPAVSDLNGDGKLEIVFGTIEEELNGKIHVLSMETKGGSEWRKFHYNSKNTGYQSGIQKSSDCSSLCDNLWTWIQGGEGIFAPCCGDDGELDNFQTGEWVCESGAAHGTENCGNGYCGEGENCGNCLQDCACLTTEECLAGICTKTCPSCDDFNNCTLDKCSQETNYECVHEVLDNCCGNGQCETGEDCGNCTGDCSCPLGKICENSQCIFSCPNSCDDGVLCTRDFCSELTNYLCEHETKKPCCGDLICNSAEDSTSCCMDCKCAGDNVCVYNACKSPEVCVKECLAIGSSFCCSGLVLSKGICITCEDKVQKNCEGEGLCREACGADSKCDGLTPGSKDCDSNCNYIIPLADLDKSKSDCEEYSFKWIKDKCCGDDEGEMWTFDNGICYNGKPRYCGNEDGFCLSEYKINCNVEDKDCTLPCLYLLPEQTIYVAENQPNALSVELVSTCNQEFKDVKLISSYLNLNQTISSLKNGQKEKINIGRSFSKGEHSAEIQVITESKEKKVLLNVIAVQSSKIKEKISSVINTSLTQFKMYKDSIYNLGLVIEFAKDISTIELNLNKAQQDLLNGDYAGAQEVISTAAYILRLGSVNLLSRVQVTGWGILTILFSVGAVLSFILYYILSTNEKYKRHLANYQKNLSQYKQLLEEYKKPGIYTLEKEGIKSKLSMLYRDLQELKKKIKKEEEIIKKSAKEIK